VQRPTTLFAAAAAVLAAAALAACGGSSGTSASGTSGGGSSGGYGNRSGSSMTYNGHALYTYAGDTGSGQTNGEGLDQFGAEWYVVSPTGQKIENDSS
jgi:hypothetical protein